MFVTRHIDLCNLSIIQSLGVPTNNIMNYLYNYNNNKQEIEALILDFNFWVAITHVACFIHIKILQYFVR